MQLVLFFTMINVVAFIGGGGITTTVTSMILTRVPDGKVVLGTFSTAVALGTLVGGVIVTLLKPSKKSGSYIFKLWSIIFIMRPFIRIILKPTVWIIFNFFDNLPLSLLNANLAVIMRTIVPIEIQGRVFSVRDTMQYCTIPVGYLLGGILADYIFEPFMRGNSLLKHVFVSIVGDGNGSGIALLFIITGVVGITISLFI